jgi:TPR repeat protein
VKQNLQKAKEWYQKAANGGSDYAKKALERLQNY